MTLKKRIRACGVMLGVAVYCAPVTHAEEIGASDAPVPAVLNLSFPSIEPERLIAANDALSLRFAATQGIEDGRFAVMLGTEDLTANFVRVSGAELTASFAAMPLPESSNTLHVYQISSDNQWLEIGQLALAVSPSSSVLPVQHAAVFTPSLILGMKAQLHESHSALATPPLRPTYQDLTLQGGLSSEYEDDNFSLKTQMNIAGSSYRPEAVDFAARGLNAPKIDVANYLLESRFNHRAGVTGVQLGHVQAGVHPLLAADIANRGAVFSQKFNDRLDVSAALQNGTAIVGSNNLTGLADAQHRLTTLTLGAEVLERAGGLRLETTAFRGSVKHVPSDGSTATLQDAEQSQGWGVRLQGQSEGGSLRGDAAFARSSYILNGDSATSTPSSPATHGRAWSAGLGYDLLSGYALSPTQSLSVSLQARREYSSATYKSLGAEGQAADFVNDSVGVNANLGAVTSQLQMIRRADNVDNDVAFFKNRTHTLNFTLSAPLGTLLNRTAPSMWMPTASYGYVRNHSFADAAYLPTWTTVADLSNVQAVSQNLGLNWVLKTLNLGYQYSHNLQDNRQVGYELNDSVDAAHNLTLGYKASDNLMLNGVLGSRVSEQKLTGVLSHGQKIQAAANWKFPNRYTLIPSLMMSHDYDSLATLDSRIIQSQVQLIKPFDLIAFGKKHPAQWLLSYTGTNTRSLGTSIRYMTLNAALSFSFF
jgi:hypothetical protein